jgi:hypothetical protein
MSANFAGSSWLEFSSNSSDVSQHYAAGGSISR